MKYSQLMQNAVPTKEQPTPNLNHPIGQIPTMQEVVPIMRLMIGLSLTDFLS